MQTVPACAIRRICNGRITADEKRQYRGGTELYLGAFHHDGKMGEYFRANLPLYFKKYIESDYCMAYVLTDGDSIIGIITAIIVPSIGMNSISIDTVAISPAYQHKGYGTQMFSEFFEKTRGSFYSLNAQRSGNGYRLYDKVGFSDETDRAYMIYMLICPV